ncbi:MAG TPA: hypothetical protein PLK76_02025 [bacterium]|nr:hypothetical protein [bacterium]
MDIIKKPTIEKFPNNLTPEKNIEAGGFELENKFEQGIEENKIATEQEQNIKPVSAGSGVGAPGIDQSKSPLHQTLEAILEEDLGDLYFSLPENKQQEFKIKGEETTKKIAYLLTNAKATFKKVFNLIFKWLKIIPGVNKYFLEQEAKIKADRILEIK